MTRDSRIVVLAKRRLNAGEIDGIDYLKKYGEHLLAVKLQNWRRGHCELATFIDDLNELVLDNDDELSTD